MPGVLRVRAALLLALCAAVALGAETAARPLFGFASIGGANSDDRGPSGEVIAAHVLASAAEIHTVVTSAWQLAQPEDSGDAVTRFEWEWYERAVAPFRGGQRVLVSHIVLEPPAWLSQRTVGASDSWAGRGELFLRAFFERCTADGIFLHIVENPLDTPTHAGSDWINGYIAHLCRTYQVAKAVDPRHQIIGGNMRGVSYYEELYRQGFEDCCDMVGLQSGQRDARPECNTEEIAALHALMERRGDGHKQIFLVSGWGPGRELRAVQRLNAEERVSAVELGELRRSLLLGYQSLSTRTARYDPAWIFGAYFTPFNDSYGGYFWRQRAAPSYGNDGHLASYIVDGRMVGKDLRPRFYNGGLARYAGSDKDTLLRMFPGDRIALVNPGFEYEERDRTPHGWQASGRVVVDRSWRRSGSRGLRLEPRRRVPAYVEQQLSPESANRAKDGVALVAYARVLDATGAKQARVRLLADGVPCATAELAAGQEWTRFELKAAVPPTVSSLVLRIESGLHGPIWIDDCFLVCGQQIEAPTLRAFVYDCDHRPVEHASVKLVRPPHDAGGTIAAATLTGSLGELIWNDPPVGVYDLRCTAEGFESTISRGVVLYPNAVNVVGFELKPLAAHGPSHIRGEDTRMGGEALVAWKRPTGCEAAGIAVYRSENALELGTRIAMVTGEQFLDAGLANFKTYWYSLIPLDAAGSCLIDASAAWRNAIAVTPTAGETLTLYDIAEEIESSSGVEFAQTFVASERCNLFSARCVAAGTDLQLTFKLRRGGIHGVQVGPVRVVAASRDLWATVYWPADEISFASGETYALVITGNGNWMLRHSSSDVYPRGKLYIDGKASEHVVASRRSVDAAVIIDCVRPPEIELYDIHVRSVTSNTAHIVWKTAMPASCEVGYGVGSFLSRTFSAGSRATKDHEIYLTQLSPRTTYGFLVRARRVGTGTEVSPMYWFTTDEP